MAVTKLYGLLFACQRLHGDVMKVVYCPCGKSVEVEAEDQLVGTVGQPSESDHPRYGGSERRGF
jgi:hypothetical protein